eukprot:7292354-Prymnesium_polylepis.1
MACTLWAAAKAAAARSFVRAVHTGCACGWVRRACLRGAGWRLVRPASRSCGIRPCRARLVLQPNGESAFWPVCGPTVDPETHLG